MPTAQQVRQPRILRGFERTVRYHREWLGRRGFLDRPWLILGAAPSPTLPAPLGADTVLVCIKYAGRSAKRLGLPPADLTFLLHKTPAEEVADLQLGQVIRMGRHLSWDTAWRRILRNTAAQECELTHRERDSYVISTLGSLFRGVGPEERPSNGVALACFAVAVGVPRIRIAGISLDTDGYDYDPSARIRRHLAEDAQALSAMARLYPQVSTSEPSLARRTGLPHLTGA